METSSFLLVSSFDSSSSPFSTTLISVLVLEDTVTIGMGMGHEALRFGSDSELDVLSSASMSSQ